MQNIKSFSPAFASLPKMITLNPITPTTYKVILQTEDLTDEERTKLLRKRDLFPAEFVHMLIDLLPPDQSFDTYDHYNMTLYVK
jgi:hypothetical protein